MADLGTIREVGENDADEVLECLTTALERLKTQTSSDKLPISPYGPYGNTFCFDLNDEFAFTFKKVTDRDSERRPITLHLYLKNLLRRN